jgi:hypothetical protein
MDRREPWNRCPSNSSKQNEPETVGPRPITTMKPLVPTLVLSLAASVFAAAGPVQRSQVSADAKWLLHLDADAFRSTVLGGQFMTDVLDKKAAKAKDDLRSGLDFELDWRQIHSITAYGSQHSQHGDPKGILLVKTDMLVQPALERAIAKDIPGLRVERFEYSPAPLYQLNGDPWVAFQPGGLVILSKARESVEKALAVLSGERANLASTTTFEGYPAAPFSFFMLGVAEGLGRDVNLPPNAAVLKQAEGGRLVIGEKADRVALSLDVKTASPDVAQQIQQVVQGLLALGALSADQKPDLAALVQGASVTQSGAMVTVGLELPVAKVLNKIKEKN